MNRSMKRFVPIILFALGIAVIAVLMPRFNAAQPKRARIIRAEAVAIADDAARKLGIPVAHTESALTWTSSPLLEKELRNDPERRRRADDDPTIGPRLGAYRRTYYRPGVEKSQPWGDVIVDPIAGEVLGARKRLRPQDPGKSPAEGELRAQADAFVHPRTLRGA